MWDEVCDHLDVRWNVHVLDLPGFGENTNPVNSISEMVDAVIEYMDKAGIERVCVFGHSMGGYVALDMLDRFPSRIIGIGLVHSHGYADSLEVHQKRQKQIEFLERQPVDLFLKPFSRQLVGETNSNDKLLEKAYNLVKRTPSESVIAATRAMMKRPDRSELLQNTQVPVAWLIGKEDRFIDLPSIEKQAIDTANNYITIWENVGHLAPLEVPQKTAQWLKEVLSWMVSVNVTVDTQ